MTAAESPDGAVFVAPQDPTTPGDATAWVVDDNGPAVVAEHAPSGIAALAADGNNFYVATYYDVYGFNRFSGNQVGQWTLPRVRPRSLTDTDLVSMAAAGENVLVSITQGNSVKVFRLNPASPAPLRLLVQGLDAAIGSDGSVYYERADHRLAVVRPAGASARGPLLTRIPNGVGGVQYLDAVAGGAVWVSEPTGQGLDAAFATYDVTTLNALESFSGVMTSSVVDTAAGPLVLEPPTGASCPPPSAGSAPSSCVLRIDLHGTVSDPVGIGTAVSLLGPSPAVVAADTSTNQFQLIRLS